MKSISQFFSRQWILTTLLVLIAIGVMIRLGIWQLDRLQQRREFNQHYLFQIESPPISLNETPIPPDLIQMEYRDVSVRGTYDHDREVAIRNQSWQGQAGVHLLTPLRINSLDLAVFVDRGWIPLDQYQTGDWSAFETNGAVEVIGIIRNAQTSPTFGGQPDPTQAEGESLRAWNFVNLPAIANQIPYSILPIYIQETPSQNVSNLPYPSQPEIEVTEGPHLGYAIQWFSFAMVLAVGYPFFIHHHRNG